MSRVKNHFKISTLNDFIVNGIVSQKFHTF